MLQQSEKVLPKVLPKVAWGLQLIKKETLAQVLACGFCKIFRNNFLYVMYKQYYQ